MDVKHSIKKSAHSWSRLAKATGLAAIVTAFVAASASARAEPARGAVAQGHTFSGAAAQGHALWMSVSPAAKDCPSALELHQRIKERLGKDPFVDDSAPSNSVQVAFTRVNEAYRAKLVLRDAESNVARERQFEDISEDCRQLADAVVLGITLLLEGGASNDSATSSATTPSEPAGRPAPTPEPPVIVAATPQAQEEPAAVSRNDASRRARVSSEVWVGPLFSHGVVSSDGLGYGVGVLGILLPFGPFGFAWGADYQAGSALQRGHTRYEFSQTAAFVGPVWVVRLLGGLTVMPSAGLLAGVTHAAVVTHNPTDPGDFAFVGGRFGAAIRARLIGPLALGASGHVRMPLNRSIFRAVGLAEPVWRQPYWGLAAEVGLGLQFD